MFSFLATETEMNSLSCVKQTFHHPSPTPVPGCTEKRSIEGGERAFVSMHFLQAVTLQLVEVWNSRLGLGQFWIVEWDGGIGEWHPLGLAVQSSSFKNTK